jgi:hypothetical protein
MPRVQGPSVVHHHIATNTVSGEVTINLNLTITINDNGAVQVSATTEQPHAKPVEEKKIPDTVYAIPEFEATELLHGFGENATW